MKSGHVHLWLRKKRRYQLQLRLPFATDLCGYLQHSSFSEDNPGAHRCILLPFSGRVFSIETCCAPLGSLDFEETSGHCCHLLRVLSSDTLRTLEPPASRRCPPEQSIVYVSFFLESCCRRFLP